MDRLSLAIGAYPYTAALRAGAIPSSLVAFDVQAIAPINRAFAPMVRDNRFDVCEMAIGTVLQAKAWGKPLALLPVVLAARFQEGALLCRRDRPVRGPADLAGRRVGLRAYSQTTGLWLRGILAHDFGVAPDAVDWVTFEDAHVAEVGDPPFVRRAAAGGDMLAMLRTGELDAVIVGNDLPDDADLRTVFPDPGAAAEAFRARHGFVPVNHVLVMRADLARTRPDLAEEVIRMVAASAALVPSPGYPVVSTRAAMEPALATALAFSQAQGLLPGPLSLDETWSAQAPAIV